MSTAIRTNYTEITPGEVQVKKKESAGFDKFKEEKIGYWKTNQEQGISGEEDVQSEGTITEEEIDDSIKMTGASNQEYKKIDYSMTLLSPPESDKTDQKAQLILRTHFANQILADLRKIQKHFESAIASLYIDSLLRTMRAMEELSPYDPYIEVVVALHDALAYKDNWDKFSAEQYKGAYRILKELANRQRIDSNIAEKAIMKLEKLGFDTTPFRLNIDFKSKIESED